MWLTNEELTDVGRNLKSVPKAIHVQPGPNIDRKSVLAEVKAALSRISKGDYDLVNDPPCTGLTKRAF